MTDGRYSFLKMLGMDKNPNPEEVKEIRKKELKNATRILGLPEKNIIFLDFIDGTLMNNINRGEEEVTKILIEHRPVEVYYPYINDGHIDHRATNQIVKNSLKKISMYPTLYQYSIAQKYARIGPIITSLLNIFYRNIIYSDISNFLHIKKAAIKEFKSDLLIISSKNHNSITHDLRKFLIKTEKFYVDNKNMK